VVHRVDYIVNVVDDHRPDHLLAALERLDLRIGAGLARRIDASGLRLRGSEGRILGLIAPGGSRPTDLAAGAWISKQAVGKRIQDLADRGLVRLDPDPTDRRAVLVRRTPAGDDVRDVTEAAIADLERELAAAVGPERYRAFRATLDDLSAG
jgi:DNA-binding MarR family transcriptional regulator